MIKSNLESILFFIIAIFSIQNINAQCEDNGNYWNESWVSCTTSQNPNPARGNSHWILYEFHEFQYITSSHIWNANRTNESGWGAKDVVIDYSLDGNIWTELGTFTFPQASESTNYNGFAGPDFGGLFINKILITVLSTYSGNACASLAEVQFNIDQNACYGELDVCGQCNGPGELNWYADIDGDGLGNPEFLQTSCVQPPGFVENNSDPCDNGILIWEDVAPLFVDNGCTGCHGGSGGLSLTTYDGLLTGGNKCGSNLLSGNNLVGIITVQGYNACGTPISGPSMNDRVGGAFDPAELAKLQAWIDDGAYEHCSDICEANTTISTTYENGDIILHEASNKITANNLIKQGANVIYDAGFQVCLDPGFEVQAGTEFLGKTEGCGTDSNQN